MFPPLDPQCLHNVCLPVLKQGLPWVFFPFYFLNGVCLKIVLLAHVTLEIPGPMSHVLIQVVQNYVSVVVNFRGFYMNIYLFHPSLLGKLFIIYLLFV